MRVRLDQVREHPVSFSHRVDVQADELGGEGLLAIGPVQMSGELRRAEGVTGVEGEGAFQLRAHLEYPQTLSCFRCLEPTQQEIATDFELLILADAEAEQPLELELEESDLDVVRVDEEVDLEALMQEQLKLNLPMKPLCKDDCRGLCTSCGADLNLSDCQCQEPAADSRWSALEALKERLPDS